MKDTLPARVRFGVFELDLRSGELRVGDETTLLQEQPLRVLRMLVEREGELVTREEIKKKLWPHDTIVEFDHSINAVINNLRRALGDSADEPKYIETLARRGYRLMVPIERVSAEDSLGAISTPSASSGQALSPKAGEKGGVPDDGAFVHRELQPPALTGRTVSHYRVLDIIGGGGMGVVYRAEDLKLGRQVALKFLPEELGSDLQALERFSREARAASSLDHSNICDIHEFGEHEGRPFIVMQLLEGQTLRDHLAALAADQKALPLDRLLEIAIQITDGLQAAHEKGIIHRDIKPANIFLTNKGTVKILDFGLAKLLELSEPEAEEQQIPRGLKPAAEAAAAVTRTGVAMGTEGYMSPEQVRGEKLDARTDLFCFGLVLYEMATGQRAFSGDTVAVVHDAILNATPVRVRELNSTLPAGLVSIIDRALQKDRQQRYQSTAAMRADLRGIRPRSSTPSRRSRWMLLGAAAVVLCVAGYFAFRSGWRKKEPVKQLSVRQLTSESVDGPISPSIELSPDGKRLVYLDRKNRFSLLNIDSGESESFPNTASVVPGRWFPDGEHLFVTKAGERGTWKMSIKDRTLQRFRDETLWAVPSPNGQQVAVGDENTFEIFLMWPNGETSHRLSPAHPPWIPIFRSVSWSPTGRRIAFAEVLIRTDTGAWRGTTNLTIVEATRVQTCDQEGRCSIILADPRLWIDEDSDRGLVWLRNGDLVFSLREPPPHEHGSNLWALVVDPDTGQPRGEPRRLTNWTGFKQINVTASADGKRLVFQRMHTVDTVKIAELRDGGRQLGSARPLNSETWWSRAASWTHDAKSVLFTATVYGKTGIFRQETSGSNARVLVSGASGYGAPVITPDGQFLLYTEYLDNGSARLMRAPLEGGPASVLVTGSYGYRCALPPSKFCVMSERQGMQLVFWMLDPFNGRGRELARVPLKQTLNGLVSDWDLSPDAKHVALVDAGASDDQVRILGLEGASSFSVHLKGWNILQYVNWSADGRHLYVSGFVVLFSEVGKCAILETDLAGDFKVLTELPPSQGWITNPLPSPDGRYLIYNEKTYPASVVMLENF